MGVLFLLIPLSAVVALAFLLAFIKANKNGQFNDIHTPPLRILQDATIKNKKK